MDPLVLASLMWQNYQQQQLLTAVLAQGYLNNLSTMNTFTPPPLSAAPASPELSSYHQLLAGLMNQGNFYNIPTINSFAPPTPSPSLVITELPESPISSPHFQPFLSEASTRPSTPHSFISSSYSLPSSEAIESPPRLAMQTLASNKTNLASIKKPRSSKREEKMLWVFILKHLLDSSKRNLVEWTNERSGEFRFVDPDGFARVWGEHKGGRHTPMRFEVMTRGLRFYYKKGIVEKVKNQKNLFRFLNVEDLKEKLKKM